jgi:2-dehydro-3-deoxyphosphogluconate aldolase/(4S)-4-hydroxy-2-oxoglutarate aldolase
VGGTWIAKRNYIDAGQFDQITRNAQEALARLHGFELLAAEVDTNNDQTGLALLQTLAKVFVPTPVPGLVPLAASKTEAGSLCIACNNIQRAAVWLESNGQNVGPIDPATRSARMSATMGNLSIQLIEKP